MRVHVDLGQFFVLPTLPSNILQVDPDPAFNALSNITGRFLIPAVDGTAVSVTAASYVSPANGTDVSSQVFGQLLARFPQYRHVAFNPLLTAADVAQLDTTATFDVMVSPDPAGGPNPVPWSYESRFMTGSTSTMPMGTAVLPANITMSAINPLLPARLGVLITDNFDLTVPTSGVGADDFMVYWKVYRMNTTSDIAGVAFGSTFGMNDPALKYAQEINQEGDFQCYISVDDGANWVQVTRLQQIAFCGKSTKVKLAFINTNLITPYYLAHFAILF